MLGARSYSGFLQQGEELLQLTEETKDELQFYTKRGKKCQMFYVVSFTSSGIITDFWQMSTYVFFLITALFFRLSYVDCLTLDGVL